MSRIGVWEFIIVIPIIILLLYFLFQIFTNKVRSVKVNVFSEEDANLPGDTQKVDNEKTIIHAKSWVGRAQAFVTNKRVIVHTRTWFGSAWTSSYIPIETITNAQMTKSSPWGFLVIGAFGLLGLFSGESAAIVIGIIWILLFFIIWLVMRRSAIVIAGYGARYLIYSKNEGGLKLILRAVDKLRLVDRNKFGSN